MSGAPWPGPPPLTTGPTVVAGGHVEPDEEVTNQVTQPAPCPRGQGAWDHLGAGQREGQTQDSEESGTGLSDLLPSHSQLLEGGLLRELWEESGLQLPQGQFSWTPLGLWEVRQGAGRASFLFNQEPLIISNPPKPTEQPYLP